jgi:hypothetical protein
VAVYVSFEEEDREGLEKQWRSFNVDIPLEIVYSPYRELVAPIERYIDELDDRWDNDTITVVIPEFVVGKWYEHVLHNQSALFLKGKLLFREGTVVTSVPYHVPTREAEIDGERAAAENAPAAPVTSGNGEVVSPPTPLPDRPGDSPRPAP